MKGPLREVVRIQDSVGPNGGGIWHLVLVCGHFEARRKPSIIPGRGPNRIFLPTPTAPKRVRCWQCGEDPKVQAAALERALKRLRSHRNDGGD